MSRKTKNQNIILHVFLCLLSAVVLVALERAFLTDAFSVPTQRSALDLIPLAALEPPTLHGPYDVVYVIDGDTAFIDIDGIETKVRFIGIDTPESVHQDESRNTPEGKTASEFTKKLLTGKQVYLEYDISTEDDYGRTLAYVYLDDGVTLVEDEILRAGMAMTLTIQPNSKYASHFHDIQVEAREAGAGFWGTGFFN